MDPRSQQQRPPPGRARSKSGFSFRSDKSGSSSGKAHKRKESLVETAAEKRKTHMSQTTKANPNAAINEAQPIALALEKPTISGLQNIQCNDVYGNLINDPDRSNPTRWRMERPLETIRSFEVAIDRAYAHRHSTYYRPGAPQGAQSRRTSSHWGGNQNNGYEPSVRQSNGLPSSAGYGASRDSYVDNGYGHPLPPKGDPRFQSDQALSRYNSAPVYPAVGSSRSKDTLNTGGSSGSDQSSIERANGITRPIPTKTASGYSNSPDGYYEDGRRYNQYGTSPQTPSQPQAGYVSPQSGMPNYPNHPNHPNYGNNGYPQMQDSRPPPPLKDPRQQQPMVPPKNTVQFSTNQVPTGAVQPAQDQRQSWFKKRFSRSK